MSRLTTNYGYNISEGSDLVNPLVDIFPNWEAIDSDLKDVSDDAVGRATELTTGTVHALTRSDTGRDVFVFTATSAFTAGDTFTLDGTQVSALTPAGEQLATGCYIIGSDVLVAVHGTLMTMYVSPTKVADSDKLDGHDSTYFATASNVSDLSDDLDAVSDKVGTGVLTTTAQNCIGAINELDSGLTADVGTFSHSWSSASGDITRQNVIIPKGGLYLVNLTARVQSGASGQFSFFIDNVANKVYSNAGTTILGTVGATLQNCTSSFSVVVDTRNEVNDYSLVVALWSAGTFTVGIDGNYVKIPTN